MCAFFCVVSTVNVMSPWNFGLCLVYRLFHMNGYMNCQNMLFLSSENPCAVSP
jgi:hypothetical protein